MVEKHRSSGKPFRKLETHCVSSIYVFLVLVVRCKNFVASISEMIFISQFDYSAGTEHQYPSIISVGYTEKVILKGAVNRITKS